MTKSDESDNCAFVGTGCEDEGKIVNVNGKFRSRPSFYRVKRSKSHKSLSQGIFQLPENLFL